MFMRVDWTDEGFDGPRFSTNLKAKRVFHKNEPPLLVFTSQSISHAIDLVESILCIINQCLSLDARLSTVHILHKLPLKLTVISMREKLIVHQHNLSLQLLISSLECPELILKHIHVVSVNLLKVERKDLNLKMNLLGARVLTAIGWGLCSSRTPAWRDSDGVLLFGDPLLQLIKIG
jgi:hypothetical protein